MTVRGLVSIRICIIGIRHGHGTTISSLIDTVRYNPIPFFFYILPENFFLQLADSEQTSVVCARPIFGFRIPNWNIPSGRPNVPENVNVNNECATFCIKSRSLSILSMEIVYVNCVWFCNIFLKRCGSFNSDLVTAVWRSVLYYQNGFLLPYV